MTPEQLFLQELALIERVIGWVCVRRGLRGADAEDFASTVKLRLIENDYDILGRFRGQSSLKTYLAAVVNNHYLDYRAHKYGKWRPSAEARRQGPLAVRLESLLYRDGLGFDEACGVLQTAGCKATRDELLRLRERLPKRGRRVIETLEAPELPDPAPGPPDGVEKADRQLLADKTLAALRKALGELPDRDRIVIRMHVERGFTIADVARALGQDQKLLYRRRDALLKSLRRRLEADGIREADVLDLLATLDWEGES